MAIVHDDTVGQKLDDDAWCADYDDAMRPSTDLAM